MISEKIKRELQNIYDIKKFYFENLKYWKKRKGKINNNNKIMVEIQENNLYEIEQNINTAKVIQEMTKEEIIILKNGFIYDTIFREKIYSHFLVKSYCLEKKINIWECMLKNFYKYFESNKMAKNIYKTIEEKNDIEKIKYKEILIGDLIYDEYIKMNDKIYTIEKNKKLLNYIKEAIFLIEIYEEIFKTKNINYLVIVDKCYLKHGVLYRVALKYDVKVFMYGSVPKVITKQNMYKHFYHPNKTIEEIKKEIISEKNEYEKTVMEYLEKRFSAKALGLDIKPAYKNKKKYTRNEIIKELSLDPNKKNAIIMCHAFSDFPHIDSGSLYSDYYTWLEELLEIIKNNTKINWLIKAHPTSYYYFEEGEVERLLKRKKINNVKIVPKDFSPESLKNVADVILSVRGTAGIEYGAFGIPTINAGKGFYSDYEVCYEPNNIKEYKKLLEQIEKIPKLNEEQIKKIKILIYYIMIKSELMFPYLLKNPEKVSKNHYYILNNILENRKNIEFKKNRFYSEILQKINEKL